MGGHTLSNKLTHGKFDLLNNLAQAADSLKILGRIIELYVEK